MKTDSNYLPFILFLQERLQRPLPGFAAHSKMAPTRFAGNGLPPAPPNARRSAALVLLYNDNNAPAMLLTLRSKLLRSHRGQICFPGGRIESSETPVQAALRETAEETGIAEPIMIVGQLSPIYVPPSNSHITPIVGALDELPRIFADNDEVDEAFAVRLDELIKPDAAKPARIMQGDARVEAPYWDVHPAAQLWGATAMITSELLVLYDEFLREE